MILLAHRRRISEDAHADPKGGIYPQGPPAILQNHFLQMDEATFPTIDVLTDLLVRAFDKVFNTMLQTKIKFVGRLAQQTGQGTTTIYDFGSRDPLVVGSVGFAGEANGMVYQYMEDTVAVRLAALMTGMTEKELRQPDNLEIVNDVIGELTNMTVGTFKNEICDLGFNCKVTLPTVLRGSQISVDSVSSADRWVFRFEVIGSPLIADLFIQKTT